MTAPQNTILQNKVMYSCHELGVCQGRTPRCADCACMPNLHVNESRRNRWLPGVALAVEGPFGPSRAQWLQNLLHMARDLAFACATVGFAVGMAYGVCKAYGF